MQIAFREKYDIKIRKVGEDLEYWDIIRKKWLLLSPEEWVRQILIHHFIDVLAYPKGRIAIEKELKYGALSKRYDIVVYDAAMQPWLLVECKQENVPINEKTLHQLLIYQRKLQAPYCLLTNGKENKGFSFLNGNIESINNLPEYPKNSTSNPGK